LLSIRVASIGLSRLPSAARSFHFLVLTRPVLFWHLQKRKMFAEIEQQVQEATPDSKVEVKLGTTCFVLDLAPHCTARVSSCHD
jgi:hypothetical protein